MLDLLEFVFTLFTSPLEAIATIAILGLMLVGIKWFANHSKSNLSLDAAPDVILRQRLKFADADLEHNRSLTISPKQIKRMRNEVLILLLVYTAFIILYGFLFAAIFWDDVFGGGLDLFVIGFASCMGLFLLFVIGLGIWQVRRYIKDLRTKSVVPLLSPFVFGEHKVEYMGVKIWTHRYKIIVNAPRLPEPLSLEIGFMSEDVWSQVRKLRHQTAILYVAPNTSKLLSFELVASEPAISQKDVR